MGWGACGNKLKIVSRGVMSCFHKLSQIVSQVSMPVDKLKSQSNKHKYMEQR